ncbi:hypothetical protein HanRHA438_Chr10g0450291 [Helianthus annuus]|nr:hypothetical protein HanRHA438_Chr10g0450291 [Helianthus annuus]
MKIVLYTKVRSFKVIFSTWAVLNSYLQHYPHSELETHLLQVQGLQD